MYPARILIADDDMEIIKLVSANLKYEKYETLIAMNGIEALEIVEREMPDLVLLDIETLTATGIHLGDDQYVE